MKLNKFYILIQFVVKNIVTIVFSNVRFMKKLTEQRFRGMVMAILFTKVLEYKVNY